MLTLASLPEFKEGSKAPEGKKTWFDVAVRGLKVVTLKKAYVMLLRTSVCGKSVEPSVDNGIFARTDADGELLWIGELAQFMDSDFDKTSKNRVFFEEEEEFLIFWTLSKKAFRAAREAGAESMLDAIRDYEFELFRMTDAFSHTGRLAKSQDAKDNPFELLDEGYEGSAIRALIREQLVGAASSGNYRGHYPGYAIRLWHDDPDSIPNGNYLIVGSHALNALYLAELTYYHTLSIPQRHIQDFATFAQVKEVIHKSEAGERYPALDKATQTYRIGTMTYENAAWEKFRNYAYICAKNANIPRDLFVTAVDYTWLTLSSDWWEAADEIKRREPLAVHPADHTKPSDKWPQIGVEHILPLFDFYRFGVEYEENGWYRAIQESEKETGEQVKKVSAHIREYLSKHVPKSGLAVALEMRYIRDAERWKEVWARYLALSELVHHDWSAASEVENQAAKLFWQFAEWTGVLVDKIDEVVDEHYRKIENIMRVWENVEQDPKRLEKFIKNVAEWNEKIKRKPASNVKIRPQDQQIKQIRLALEDVDVGKKRVVVRAVTTQGEQVALELDFLAEDIQKVKKQRVPTRRTQHWKRPRMRTVEKLVTEKQARIMAPWHEVQLWPKGLVVLGETIGLIVNARKLLQELQQESGGEIGTTLARVGRDFFQVIDSSSDLLAACFRRSSKWMELESSVARVSKFAKVPGAVLEVYVNYREGAEILMMGEDSEAARAHSEGEDLIATLVEIKGAALVIGTSVGVAGGLAAVAGGIAEAGLAAAGLAFPPLGLALAATAVIVIVVEFSIYILAGPANIMDDLKKDLRKASEREFGCQWVNEKEPQKHRTLDSVRLFESRLTVLLN
jgi:hypothetical protein